jgi:hypothetical protein
MANTPDCDDPRLISDKSTPYGIQEEEPSTSDEPCSKEKLSRQK